MEDEELLEYNFWPSFADLMLSLVLVLVVTMVTFIFYLSLNSFDLQQVQDNQKAMVGEFAASFNAKDKPLGAGDNYYGISFNNSDSYDIKIMNDAKVQQVTFNTLILFDKDGYLLNPKGQEVLKKFGATLKKNLFRIQEIQIQGHADSNKTTKYKSNLELAALRSMTVFEFFQKDVGIDPAKNLMSITSFGEYKPVNRRADDSTFNMEKLADENATQTQRDVNRRIEILLFYR